MGIENIDGLKPVFPVDSPSNAKEVPLKNSSGEIIGSTKVTFENGAYNVEGVIDSGAVEILDSRLGKFFGVYPDGE